MSLNLDKSSWKRVAFRDVVRHITDRVDAETSGLERFLAGEHILVPASLSRAGASSVKTRSVRCSTSDSNPGTSSTSRDEHICVRSPSPISRGSPARRPSCCKPSTRVCCFRSFCHSCSRPSASMPTPWPTRVGQSTPISTGANSRATNLPCHPRRAEAHRRPPLGRRTGFAGSRRPRGRHQGSPSRPPAGVYVRDR